MAMVTSAEQLAKDKVEIEKFMDDSAYESQDSDWVKLLEMEPTSLVET